MLRLQIYCNMWTLKVNTHVKQLTPLPCRRTLQKL